MSLPPPPLQKKKTRQQLATRTPTDMPNECNTRHDKVSSALLKGPTKRPPEGALHHEWAIPVNKRTPLLMTKIHVLGGDWGGYTRTVLGVYNFAAICCWYVRPSWGSVCWYVRQSWGSVCWYVRLSWGSVCWYVRLSWGSVCWYVRQSWGSVCWYVRLSWGRVCWYVRPSWGSVCWYVRLSWGSVCWYV